MIVQYLKYRRLTIFLYIFIVIFFPVIHYLYNLPMKSIVYSVEIVSFLFLLCGLYDFRDFIKRHNNLVLLKKEINIYSADFKEPNNLIEYDFQELVKELYRQTTEEMGKIEAGYLEQIDYYTMWVHQIKTPIAAIRLILQNGRECNSDTISMEEELFKIEQYVEMVLHYLRIETMSSDLELHKVDVDDIIKETVKKYSTIFIHKRISLNYEELNQHVLSDEKWCTFLVEQILSNALKYTNQGSIQIYIEDVNENDIKTESTFIDDSKENDSKERDSKVRDSEERDSKVRDSEEKTSKEKTSKEKDSIEKTIKEKAGIEKANKEKVSKENNQIKLVIKDTGIGIRKEDTYRIFDKGFTGYNGRWDKKASGIGLYLCDKVARKLAHKIEIDSEVSKGTTVKITFPNSKIEVY